MTGFVMSGVPEKECVRENKNTSIGMFFNYAFCPFQDGVARPKLKSYDKPISAACGKYCV